MPAVCSTANSHTAMLTDFRLAANCQNCSFGNIPKRETAMGLSHDVEATKKRAFLFTIS